MNGPPLIPFDHRARRRILRRLHKVPDISTAAELSTDLTLALTEVLYHAQILVKYEKVRECRRSADPASTRFKSMVANDPEIIALLVSTQAEDEPQ